MSDRLHDTLTSLRSDTDSAPLADSMAVRARGNQRTRRQAVGTSLAVVAVVAGVIGVSGALTGTNNKAENLPADPTTSQTPAPAPTDEARPAIDSGLLLEPEDLPSVPAQTFSVGETIEDATSADADERSLTACQELVNPRNTTPVRALLRTFPSDLDAYGFQWTAQYDNEAESQSVFNQLASSCTSNPDRTFLPVGPDGAEGPTGFRSTQFSADPGSEFNGDILGVARRGEVIIVFDLRAMVKEGDIDLQAFDDTLLTAADRVANR